MGYLWCAFLAACVLLSCPGCSKEPSVRPADSAKPEPEQAREEAAQFDDQSTERVASVQSDAEYKAELTKIGDRLRDKRAAVAKARKALEKRKLELLKTDTRCSELAREMEDFQEQNRRKQEELNRLFLQDAEFAGLHKEVEKSRKSSEQARMELYELIRKKKKSEKDR